MIKDLKQRAVNLKWIGPVPEGYKKVALLIPLFNEDSNCNMERRLSYFKGLAEKYRDEIDVIIIDDGSTDRSLQKLVTFFELNQSAFFVASVYPNAQKVGALFLTTLSITHEFVILSDFDTDLDGLWNVGKSIENLRRNPELMGCYYRMVPYEGSGNIFLWQQLEYSCLRVFYRIHHKEQSVPVMPGAGSCYKRSVLNNIFVRHSGLRSGEDRESTLIGLRGGYKTVYVDNILISTRPPLTLKALVKQRIRWELGYLETFSKERDYYLSEMRKMKKIGVRAVLDFLVIAFVLLLPITLFATAFINPIVALLILPSIYILNALGCIIMIVTGPKEFSELKGKKMKAVVMFPAIKLIVDYFSWFGAIRTFIRKSRKSRLKPATLTGVFF
ncbi:MAG: glycosyltransferase family 2 protein [Chryseotalea sp. WA131a]|nr:MAG: glycosyltransferase family 2 protein [Chryseotalea sp. WA131a]